MLGANPKRTSWVADEVADTPSVEWFRVIDPYVDPKTQVIAATVSGAAIAPRRLFVSTARGLYCFSADDGSDLWVYGTELPLGHSPTYANGVLYVGGLDRRVHAVDAVTGKLKAGWSFYEAGAGFETNPIVANGRVYLGSRDGRFYCLDANTGGLIWTYPRLDAPPLEPILYSPAMSDNGLIYFASNNSKAYAIRAASGELVWESAKLTGAGFHSYWPVIYTDRATGKDYVIFSGSKKSAFGAVGGYDTADREHYFKENYDIFAKGDLPLADTDAGDWVTGTRVLDAGAISNYLRNNPWKRHCFVLAADTGTEFTFDAGSYAPMNWAGATHGGNKYPPIVGYDNVLYTYRGFLAGGNMGASGFLSGWKFGTRYISQISSDNGPADEPISYTGGGRFFYWSEGYNSSSHQTTYGAIEISKPMGSNARLYYWVVPPAIKYTAINLAGTFGKNGIYSYFDGRTCMSQVPYNNKLYLITGNSLFALSPAGGQYQGPPVSSPTYKSPVVVLPPAELKKRIEGQVEAMINAGHLRPGYLDSGQWTAAAAGMFWPNVSGHNLGQYFSNPFDTILTLILALPHLSASLQQAARVYIRNEFNGVGYSTGLKAYEIADIGWKNGASREIFDDTPPMTALISRATDNPNLSFASVPRSYVYRLSDQFNVGSYPQNAFYGAWKYAQLEMTSSEAKAMFDAMKGKLQNPPALSNADLLKHVHLLNYYVTGYLGYMELERLAGYTTNIAQSTLYSKYTELLNLRVTNFSKDTPFTSTDGTWQDLNVARNFMYLTPELAEILRRDKLAAVQSAVAEYNEIAPYWFVAKYDRSNLEAVWAPLHSYAALFQAKALILKEPYEELAKYVDVPAFYRGDLFYIRNLAAALNAASSVVQNSCPLVLSPRSVLAPQAGGTWTVTVTSGSTCGWLATSNTAWIAVTSGFAGVGNGTVQVTVQANAATAARTASITIGSQTLIVQQNGTGAAGTRPVVTSVVNAAHFQPGFASATWITIYGNNMAPTSRTWRLSDFVGNKLPTQLDSVSVNVNGRPAFISYISPAQINVLAPDDSTLGSILVEVITPDGLSAPVAADKDAFAPGWFMFDPDGRKYIAAVHPDGAYLGKAGLYPALDFRPAKPGDTVMLFGTGFGTADPPTPTSDLVSQPGRLTNQVSVRIGGSPAEVRWAGLVSPGLYQFNVVVPNVPDGDQEVIAEIAGFHTQAGAYITIHG
ncbi:MAG: PQQ-binding-like beta-propeller repeat protein [Acidobacteriales bacterium]|nr:PQQ-binding-like beta-propeller repeat protein [Terriglobales bacterium]